MISLGVDPPPEFWPDEGEHRGQIVRFLRRVGEEVDQTFRAIYAGTVTTTANQASTTVSANVAVGDAVLLFPADAIAAAMAGVYALAVGGGSGILIVHPSQATTGVFNIVAVQQ